MLPNERQGKQDFLSGTEHFDQRGEILKRGALAKWKRCTPMRWQLPGRKNLPRAILLLIAGTMRWVLRRLLPLQLPNDKHARKKPPRIRVPTTERLRDEGAAQRNEDKQVCERSHNGEVRPQKRDERAQRRHWLLTHQVQIGPPASQARARGAVDAECSQMPLFHLRTSDLAVLLQLPRRSTWNDPEALASRPPLPRCVRFKSLRLPALLTQRSHRPKSTLRVAEVCFLML